MDNQNPTPSPTSTPENIPAQNPAIAESPAPQIPTTPQPIAPPPSSKSFFSTKIILLIVFLLILLGSGGTYLALSSKPKPQPIVPKPTPTSASTPLPTEASVKAGDPTTSWKTYMNDKYNYSVKYPSIILFTESNQASYTEFDKQISILVGKFDILKCTGCPPLNGTVDDIMVNNLPAKKIIGRQTAMGKVGPGQKYQSIIISHDNLFYVFSVSEFKSDYQGWESKGDIPKEELQLFYQILSTFKFTNPCYYDKTIYRSLEDALRIRSDKVCNLDLSRKNLSSLPVEVLSFKNLRTLFLNDNNITSLPSEIAQLKNLFLIDLTGNPISVANINEAKKLLPNTDIGKIGVMKPPLQ